MLTDIWGKNENRLGYSSHFLTRENSQIYKDASFHSFMKNRNLSGVCLYNGQIAAAEIGKYLRVLTIC